MSRLVALLIVGTVAGCFPTDSAATDWMYGRSWFSHTPVAEQPVPTQRSATRSALPQIGPGFAVRSTYRINVYRIRNGRSYDTTVFRQFSAHGRP